MTELWSAILDSGYSMDKVAAANQRRYSGSADPSLISQVPASQIKKAPQTNQGFHDLFKSSDCNSRCAPVQPADRARTQRPTSSFSVANLDLVDITLDDDDGEEVTEPHDEPDFTPPRVGREFRLSLPDTRIPNTPPPSKNTSPPGKQAWTFQKR